MKVMIISGLLFLGSLYGLNDTAFRRASAYEKAGYSKEHTRQKLKRNRASYVASYLGRELALMDAPDVCSHDHYAPVRIDPEIMSDVRKI